MPEKATRYFDAELYLASESRARLEVAGRDYWGRPLLGAGAREHLRGAALDAERYGAELFEALFVGEDGRLLDGYRQALAIADHADAGLRLRLNVDPAAAPDLADLHWELLYDRERRMALSRSPQTAFARYMSLALGSEAPCLTRPRILFAIVAPPDLGEYGLPAIDAVAARLEVERLLDRLGTRVEGECLDAPVTPGRLRERLLSGEFHGLHLQSHGLVCRNAPGPDSPRSVATAHLVLENEDGRAQFVPEEFFSEIFEGARRVRLVTLMACHGGTRSSADPWSGLAPSLVRRGVPAVLAPRRAIPIEAAGRFGTHFYAQLAGHGRVDAAANEARHQLYLKSPDRFDWSSMTLFTHLEDGLLWRIRESQTLPVSALEDFSGHLSRPALYSGRRPATLVGAGLVIVAAVAFFWFLLADQRGRPEADTAPPPVSAQPVSTRHVSAEPTEPAELIEPKPPPALAVSSSPPPASPPPASPPRQTRREAAVDPPAEPAANVSEANFLMAVRAVRTACELPRPNLGPALDLARRAARGDSALPLTSADRQRLAAWLTRIEDAGCSGLDDGLDEVAP